MTLTKKSLPSRERGLKSLLFYPLCCLGLVAPFAGAWIEIMLRPFFISVAGGRSLHGSVD